MAIPMNTNRITILRSLLSPTEDPYDPPSDYPNPLTVVIATNVRAVVGVPTANPILTVGDRVVYTSKLTCDPVDLEEEDLVTDHYGRIWVALGPTPFGAFGITGVQATLRLVEGLLP
jgi:hypothetical protein